MCERHHRSVPVNQLSWGWSMQEGCSRGKFKQCITWELPFCLFHEDLDWQILSFWHKQFSVPFRSLSSVCLGKIAHRTLSPDESIHLSFSLVSVHPRFQASLGKRVEHSGKASWPLHTRSNLLTFLFHGSSVAGCTRGQRKETYAKEIGLLRV